MTHRLDNSVEKHKGFVCEWIELVPVGTQFVPVWGIVVFFLYVMRRISCATCNAVTVEMVPWASGKERSPPASRGFSPAGPSA